MAIVKSIEFDDEGNPEQVTVRLTADEAAYVAVFTGKQSDESASDIMRGGGGPNRRLYESMVGDVFNRCYDGGVQDWLNDQR